MTPTSPRPALPSVVTSSSRWSRTRWPWPAAGRQRCRRRGVRRRGPVGVGAQGRTRERRAQPRQVAGRQRLPGPAARQCQHVRLLAGGHRQTVQAAYDIARFTAEDPAAGLPDAETWPRPTRWRATWTCSTPGPSTPSRPPNWRCAARPRRLATSRITNSEGAASRRSSRTSGPATRGVSAAAMPVRAIRCRCRRSPARARPCSATPGTARCATRRAGQRRSRGPLCRRACAVAAEGARGCPPAKCRCCSSRHAGRRACWAAWCRPPRAARCTARPASCWTAWASAVLADHLDITRTRTCPRARAARPSTTRACARAPGAWSMPAWCRATSCPATRRASWA
jgi:hypothetical protein